MVMSLAEPIIAILRSPFGKTSDESISADALNVMFAPGLNFMLEVDTEVVLTCTPLFILDTPIARAPSVVRNC